MAEVRDPADAEAPYTTSELESQLDDGRNVGGESSDSDYARHFVTQQFDDPHLEEEFSRSMPITNLASRGRRIQCSIAMGCFIFASGAGAVFTFIQSQDNDAPPAANELSLPTSVVVTVTGMLGLAIWVAILCEKNDERYTKMFNPVSFCFFNLYTVCSMMLWGNRYLLAGPGPWMTPVFAGEPNQFNPVELSCLLGTVTNVSSGSLLYLFMFRPLFSWAVWYVPLQIISALIYAAHLSEWYQSESAYPVVMFVTMYIFGQLISLQAVHSSESLQRDIFVHAHSLRNAMDADQMDHVKQAQLLDTSEQELSRANAERLELAQALGGARVASVLDSAVLCRDVEQTSLISTPGQAVSCTAEDGLNLLGDAVVWKYALQNLVCHAAGKSGVGSRIVTLTISSEGGDVRVKVAATADPDAADPDMPSEATAGDADTTASADLAMAHHLVGLLGSTITVAPNIFSFSVAGAIAKADFSFSGATAPDTPVRQQPKAGASHPHRVRSRPRHQPLARSDRMADSGSPRINLVRSRSNSLLGDILGAQSPHGTSRSICGGKAAPEEDGIDC
jgi:hypothetical protein